MKVIKFHRSALSRQVGEAIKIQRRGGELTLNSRTEYNRCKITRLSLEQKDYVDLGGQEEQDKEQDNQGEEDMDQDWTASLLSRRDKADSDWRKGLGRAETSASQKRLEKIPQPIEVRTKRRKYGTLGEDWGSVGIDQETTGFLYSGLEGVKRQPETVKKKRNVSTVNENNRSRKITEWTRVYEQSPPRNLDKQDHHQLAIEWAGQHLLAIEWWGGGDKNSSPHEVKKKSVAQVKCVLVHTVNQKDTKTKKIKKKAWTRLKTGLYGWRIVRNGPPVLSQKLENLSVSLDSTLGEQKTKWVPAKSEKNENIHTIFKTGNLSSRKRKLSDDLIGGLNKRVVLESKSAGLDNKPCIKED